MSGGIARAYLNGLPKRHGTTILLQHNGLPKTPFYTQKHLNGLFENLGIPSSISGSLASLRYKFSRRIQSALSESGEYLPLEESHRRFGIQLSKKLGEVLPEFGPFNTQISYLYHEPYIPDVFRRIIEHGTDRLIVVSLYPFEIPHCLEPMRKATNNALKALTKEVVDFKSGKRFYLANDKPVSFEVERLDSIGTHPSLSQYWSERLLPYMSKVDSIIFAVPMPISMFKRYQYYNTVTLTTEDFMNNFHSRLTRAISYRVAFYQTWDHSLPIFSISKSIRKQIEMLRHFKRTDPFIVPIGSLFKDFDTEYILPSSNPSHNVIRPEQDDSNLVHSFVEMLKTSILSKQYQADKISVDPLF